jgi:hypothetical protein
MINGEIYINNQETLNIEPGVEVRFTGWYKFIVHGSLLAEGTAADQILFTADDTNHRWHGIRFINATGTSLLDHCIVEYGLTKLGITSYDPEYLGGGVLCYESAAASISIKNSIIRNNIADFGGGIMCYGSSIEIDKCEIIYNEAYMGGGMMAENMASATATVSNSLIAYNSASNYAGAVLAGFSSNMEIINNVIIYNSAAVHGGGIMTKEPAGLLVRENIIAHNIAWWAGGGINIFNAGTIGTFKDNTIAYNHAVEDGGGVFIRYSSPEFESDILYFNTSGNEGLNQVHLRTASGAPLFNYCDVQGGYEEFSGPGAPSFPWWTNYLDCIEADPLFANPDNDDFSLTWENYPEPDNTRSPCIDSGKPGLFSEPDGSCNDIGAISFFQQLEVPDTQEASEITDTSFQAQWGNAYGALGYLLDVAEDDAFSAYVLENQQVDDDTTYHVGGLNPDYTYYYRVRSFNSIDTSEYSGITEVSTLATGIKTHETVDLELYPNPSKGSLNLRYMKHETRNTKFELYSLQGIKVRTLLSKVQQAGEYELTFDISDLPDGMYFVRLQIGERVEMVKIIKVGSTQ